MRIRTALFTALVANVAATALATTTVTDPKDAGSSRLDLKSVVAGGTPGTLAFTIRTYRPYGTRYLEDGGPHRYECLYLWESGSALARQADYQVCAYVIGGKLSTSVYSKAEGKLVEIGAKASRAGRNGMRFTVPTTPFEDGHGYAFRVATQDGTTRSAFDLAPVRPRRMLLP
jgi:hypothetical protein